MSGNAGPEFCPEMFSARLGSAQDFVDDVLRLLAQACEAVTSARGNPNRLRLD
ncbi:hypothetical protein [Arthrobacter sp. B2a2-09]|uniref:hypothetical protein n=1 Tax=Arthrobacter sp. B2a2-09 TaxID=2952822 RepID=UPI0022CD7EC0|nr:hypothetical protein [Arthrobacter sp. B2a2-09]MCZ9884411.1 hypothetical protein [Arthrobacter sp. B2a2-09]